LLCTRPTRLVIAETVHR